MVRRGSTVRIRQRASLSYAVWWDSDTDLVLLVSELASTLDALLWESTRSLEFISTEKDAPDASRGRSTRAHGPEGRAGLSSKS
jgi:hypothetical protein